MASHRRPTQSGLSQSTRVTVLSAAAATAAAAFAAPASADPGDTGKDRIDRLFAQAEEATEQYNKADEHADQLREQIHQAQDVVARGQERINRMRGALGAIAGAQYRAGGLDPSLALLLSEDPDTYLDKAAALDRIGERQSAELRELQQEQRRIGQKRTEATRKLAELERSRAEVARHKRTVEAKLAQARRVLLALPTSERAAFDRVSRSGRGELPDLSGAVPASGRAAAAVAAARQAVGRPYVWGANGPSGFDCSGLMQWSYAHAGVGLPRTSQAQRYAGRRVPLAEAQPGDLVAYRSDASHIAMYVGNGQVIHAPYPGAPVRYDPVGMMPISSITRV
ncbi:NlpC/P60 family protein [Streptomyces sp. TLI_146]|uniref:C40 family peptidase n=1 Tax=Streptomyces sp. TLI_146 TaxID=1938858 RepID=UPI000C6FD88F|nr:C40 family peptidase [Streptomyces sp. TLI_146]PKV85338.1 cell wall-associated NlpC family hydrolase [Streptomyces sp. TLI_146]